MVLQETANTVVSRQRWQFPERFADKPKQKNVATPHGNTQSDVQSSVLDLPSFSSTPIVEVEETLNISVHEIDKPVEDVPDSRKENVDESRGVIAESEDIPSLLSDRCGCLCGALAAEIEGIKLDIVVMQKQIEDKPHRETEKFTSTEKSGNINCLERELSNEKERRKQLESEISMIVQQRNMEINSYNQITRSLEERASKAENERDSLRLALSLVMQDKVVAESQKTTSSSTKERPW